MPRHKRKKSHLSEISKKRWNNPTEKPKPTESMRINNLQSLKAATVEVKPFVEETKYVIDDLKKLNELLSAVCCKMCNNCEMYFDAENYSGFSSTITLNCRNCESIISSVPSSKQLNSSSTSSKCFDINRRMTQAFLHIGKGHAAVEQFCMVMNLPVMLSRTFHNHQKVLAT